MKPIGILVLAAAVTAPTFAQTKPASPDATPENCKAYAEAELQVPKENRVAFVDWCIAHAQDEMGREDLVSRLYSDAFDSGRDQANADNEAAARPLAHSPQCDAIDAMVGNDSKTADFKAAAAVGKLSKDEKIKLRGDAIDCMIKGDEGDGYAASYIVGALDADWYFTAGWRAGWGKGWDAAAATVKAKQPGLWQALAQALASRPATITPGRQDAGKCVQTTDIGSGITTQSLGCYGVPPPLPPLPQ